MKQKPNVIIFFTDQQRADSTGVHGNPLGLTPNFDRLAESGAFFPEACTCQPVCAPARSSLQTGQYATSTGVYRNRKHLSTGARTLAHCFGEGGYQTAYIGKWHLAGVYTGRDDWNQEPVPRDRQGGYDYWLGAELPEFTSDEYHSLLFDRDGNPVHLPGYRSDAYVDAGIRFIQDHQQQSRETPFFLMLSLFEPHHQNHRDHFPPPRGMEKTYAGKWTPPDLAGSAEAASQLGGYWGMIKRIDEGLGRLQDALVSMNLTEDTIILYAADHGCHFKTRNSEYKRSCHESSVSIPCAFSGPGFRNRGRREELLNIPDMAPTLLEACGLEIPEEMEGRSVMPSLKDGETYPFSDKQFIQISEDKVSRALRSRRWKYAVTAYNDDGTLLDGNDNMSSDHYTEEFLYDRKADPWEQQNLINHGAMKEVKARFRTAMKELIRQTEGMDVTITPAPDSDTSGQRLVFDYETSGLA